MRLLQKQGEKKKKTSVASRPNRRNKRKGAGGEKTKKRSVLPGENVAEEKEKVKKEQSGQNRGS